MRFNKLYSNTKLLKPILFYQDINVVFSTAHSIGKTKFLEILDFCLLKDKDDFFKHNNFQDDELAFFLEIENLGKFITIKRYLNKRTPVSIAISDKSIECLDYDDVDFDYLKMGIDKAKEKLNELLDFSLTKPIENFRKYISYFLRTQDDQSDIFRLNKYKRSQDKYFKPIVADLIGLDGRLVEEKYKLEEDIELRESEIKYILSELDNNSIEYIKAEKLKLEEIKAEKENLYKKFDFYKEDDKKSKALVDTIEKEIVKLNKRKISLNRELEYINKAIRSEFLVEIDEIEGLFEELQVVFPNDLKKDYDKIIEFNKVISQDRKIIMEENRKNFQNELEDIEMNLKHLNTKRQEIISIVFDEDSFSKFKKLEKEIIEISTTIELLGEKIEKYKRLEKLEEEQEELNDKIKELNKQIQKMIKNINNGKFAQLIDEFSQVIFQERAIFVVSLNKNNNLDFEIKVADNDNFENEKDDGHTFRKLLSFLFSIVVLIYNKNNNFFRFSAIDSPFDGDIYKYQKGLFEAIDIATKKHNLQIILTTIEDEIKDKDIFDMLKQKYEILNLTEDNKLLGNF